MYNPNNTPHVRLRFLAASRRHERFAPEGTFFNVEQVRHGHRGTRTNLLKMRCLQNDSTSKVTLFRANDLELCRPCGPAYFRGLKYYNGLPRYHMLSKGRLRNMGGEYDLSSYVTVNKQREAARIPGRKIASFEMPKVARNASSRRICQDPNPHLG